jgi:dTDP-6-deoxy-L-talose 4-dehydrogenase (NAD+)
MSKAVFVTGASGFIGRHVVSCLLKNGYDIYAITREAGSFDRFDWKDQVRIIEHNINDPHINFTVPDNASLVHLAWEGLPNFKERFHYERNLPASYHFIKSLVEQGVRQILVTGTCLEYGMRDGEMDADDTTDPQNPYGFAKDALRKSLEFLQKDLNFTLQWARLFYMYGNGQNPKSLLAQLDTAIENGDAVFNMSGGKQVRDYLPIEDVAQQICTVFKSQKQGRFNICSGEPIEVKELVQYHIKRRNASISLNLGYYPYPDYEPMAFWGKNNIGVKKC